MVMVALVAAVVVVVMMMMVVVDVLVVVMIMMVVVMFQTFVQRFRKGTHEAACLTRENMFTISVLYAPSSPLPPALLVGQRPLSFRSRLSLLPFALPPFLTLSPTARPVFDRCVSRSSS